MEKANIGRQNRTLEWKKRTLGAGRGDGILDLFSQSGVLRRLENMRGCIYSRNKHIDLFPGTSAVEKIGILRSKKPLINSRERTARSGGFLTSISSNRAMWRLSFCFHIYLVETEFLDTISCVSTYSLKQEGFRLSTDFGSEIYSLRKLVEAKNTVKSRV